MSGDRLELGFIGLGIMGAPMAARLLRAGYPLRVHSRTRRKAEALLHAGAEWRDDPAAAAADCDVLFTIVSDTPDVESVLFGPRGAEGALRKDAIVVDMSTISPAATRGFAERLAQRGVALLDAPVTGGDVGARDGTLTIMVGGQEEAFERVRPALETMGKKIVHVGPSGAGQSLKACNQVLCAVGLIGVCEALTLARRNGLDLQLAIETLAGGAGGSWTWQNLGSRIVAGDLKPAFMVSLMQKDLRIVQQTAQEHRVSLPGTALAQQLLRAVEALPDGGALGTQAMICAIERLAGEDGAVATRSDPTRSEPTGSEPRP